MVVTLISQGNAPQNITKNDGAILRDVVGSVEGRTSFITRQGVTLEGVGPDTKLQNGDQITVIMNKTVGQIVAQGIVARS